jgi:hypothetical protein
MPVSYSQMPAPDPTPAYAAQQRTSPFAVAALVLGILSALGGCLLAIPSILAVVFGHLGVRQAKAGMSGYGMAMAGLILGYVTGGLFLALILINLVGVGGITLFS